MPTSRKRKTTGSAAARRKRARLLEKGTSWQSTALVEHAVKGVEREKRRLFCQVVLPNGEKCGGKAKTFVSDDGEGFECRRCGRRQLVNAKKKEEPLIILTDGEGAPKPKSGLWVPRYAMGGK